MKPRLNLLYLSKCLIAPPVGAFLFLALVVSQYDMAAQNPVDNSKNPMEPAAKSEENHSPGEYLIGVGDVLDIRVYNRPQLSREAVRVDGRGIIRMPLIENEIKAVCRTDSELAWEISTLYTEYLRSPHVEVFIKDFQSKPVAVIGAVRDPRRFQLQRKVRLLELLSFAGGPTEHAGGRIQIKHDLNIQPCETGGSAMEPAATRESSYMHAISDEAVSWYELNDLLRGDTTTGNPFVRPGDVVNVLEADRVYVIGNIYKPTAIPLKERVTLSQAVAIAGGTLPDTNLDKIRLIRQVSGSATNIEQVVDLKAINQRKAEDVVLQANDIVEVPSSSGKRFIRSLINSVSPSLSRLPVRVIP